MFQFVALKNIRKHNEDRTKTLFSGGKKENSKNMAINVKEEAPLLQIDSLSLKDNTENISSGWDKMLVDAIDPSSVSIQDLVSIVLWFLEKTQDEWMRFVNGAHDLDSSVIPEHIAQAWQRCRSRRMDPFITEAQNRVLTGQALETLLTQNRTLIEISRPFITKLFQCTNTTSFGVALFDREGYLLDVQSDERFVSDNDKTRWICGARWAEQDAGNNSIDYVLRYGKPIQVLCTQHYLQRLKEVTASSAPIHDPEGVLIGGVALTTFYFGTHPHTLGMAVAAAQAIENELRITKAFAECRRAFFQADMAYGLQKAITDAMTDAIVAVNTEGRITAINPRAEHLFGLDCEDVKGKRLLDVYPGADNRYFWDILRSGQAVSDAEVQIRTLSGIGDYTLTCNRILSSDGAAIGKVLIFSEIRKIKSLVNRFSGARANFKFSDIQGKNEKFRALIDQAGMISKSASNVLLLGESGSGKDILAQAIHNESPRTDGPYIAINCAAIPRDLIASELFGYDEGAFTGSRRGGNQGKFELADGGTIFLDEIAETPLELQAALLRVIEDKCVVRIGGNSNRVVDVRIIAATNKDLFEEVSRGNFRKDLYFRLNVFNLHLPPLRERTDDIALLVEIFMKKYASKMGKSLRGVDDRVWEVFLQHAWPGNIRELQNVVERMVNFATSERLTYDLIPPEITGVARKSYGKLDLESPVETEKRMIRHMLTLRYSRQKIAKQLNVSRATLFRRMRKYGLLEKDFPQDAP